MVKRFHGSRRFIFTGSWSATHVLLSFVFFTKNRQDSIGFFTSIYKAKVIAIQKPGKDPSSPKSYRPISLLCIPYKLYERLILMRISPLVDEKLTKDLAGFRPGRSCAGQILNLTQHIEDGYERKMLTGAAFVDLSAAYDTVQHRLMIRKLMDMTGDIDLCQVIRGLLSNRRFFVQINDKKSRWRSQKNGLPQGSVLAPYCSTSIQTINLCLRTAAGSYNIC